MLSPQILVLMSAILPLFAGIVLICGRIVLPRDQSGISLARIASTGSFAFAGIAAIQIQWRNGVANALQSVSQVVFSSEFYVTLLHDRLSLCWLILNAGVASLSLLSLSNRKPTSSNLGSKVIAIILMLAVSQGIVLLSNGLFQWMLIALSNWLLLTICFLDDEVSADKSRFHQMLITLTVADCFWMLGLIGIYFVSGTLQIPLLSEPDAFATLSDAATALMTTSVISLLISLVIRFGLFPMMTWSNRLTSSPLPLSCLLAFPVSIGGFLLIRWLPMISLFPEPRTLLIGIAALSAVLLSLSALFQQGLKRLLRLTSVPVAFAAIGIAADPLLWPQVTALFAGAIVVAVTFSIAHQVGSSSLQLRLQWGTILLLLLGTGGIESVLQSVRSTGAEEAAVQIPSVMLPLLVLSLGLFIFGWKDFIRPFENHEHIIVTRSRLACLLTGLFLLACVSCLPFFLRPREPFQFPIPYITLAVSIIAGVIAKTWRPMTKSATPELHSLFLLCQNDFHLETIIDRGITIPIEIAAALVHIFDEYTLKWFSKILPTKLTREINESSSLIDDTETPTGHAGLILTATIILITVAYLGH